MTVYISVVSHGHFDLIKELDCLVKLANEASFKIYILDNVREIGFEEWCVEHNINYLKNSKPKGFGENNNIIFKHIKAQEKPSTNDKFLVLNPDVLIEVKDLLNLTNKVDAANAKIATINLFKDIEHTQYDFSVRNYTNFTDYMSSMFLGKNTSIIDKSTIKQAIKVDWAAGSFLLFDFEHFDKLKGFDKAYHMYCEDIDICLRSDVIFGEKVLYFSNIKAVHLAQHASRSLFSKHLYWHLSSMFKYLWKKRKLSK